MKICMFTNTYLPHIGGVARSVALFAEDLRDAGHHVLIIAPTFRGSKAHDTSEPDLLRVPAIQEFNGSDFSVHIPLPFFLNERIDDFQPDLIHSHHPYLLGDTALRVARRRNLPLIFTHHTLYEQYAHYISDSKNMQRLAAFMPTNYANMCDVIVAPSGSIQDLLRQRGVTVPITAIPTGVDIAFFAGGHGQAFRKIHGIAETGVVIGHLGRLAPEKNLTYLATAVAMALKKLPDCFFLVIGDGPSADSIRQIFDTAGLMDRLIMPGKMSGQDLADAYQSMNLFAFASQSETQGMVLTEALAAGVPVIALDAPGAREVVEDGQNGRLLDGRSTVDQFAEALAGAVASPENIAHWTGKARESATAFSREQSVKKLLRLYTDAIGARQDNGEYKTEKLDLWDKFLLACRAEWDLAAQKTESVIQAADETMKVIGLGGTG